MLDFDTIEPGLDQRLQPLASAAIARMRPDRQRTRFVSDLNRVLNRQSRLGHESGSRGAKISHECIPEIVDGSARNQSPRYVRSADCATVRLLKNFVKCHRDAKRVQLLDNFLRACVAQRTELAQSSLQGVEVG